MNAANEVAVQLFLDGRITFDAIPIMIEEALAAHTPAQNISLDDIVTIDRETRELCHAQIAAVH
jgi:1-deoxy-D-xylulose-5-phosphate reductoisomerase